MNRDWYEYVIGRFDLPLEVKKMIFGYTFGGCTDLLWKRIAANYHELYRWTEEHIDWINDIYRRSGLLLIKDNVIGWRLDIGFNGLYYDNSMNDAVVIGLIKLY